SRDETGRLGGRDRLAWGVGIEPRTGRNALRSEAWRSVCVRRHVAAFVAHGSTSVVAAGAPRGTGRSDGGTAEGRRGTGDAKRSSLRFSHAVQKPRLHRRGRADAGAGDRGKYGNFQSRRCRPSPLIAGAET